MVCLLGRASLLVARTLVHGHWRLGHRSNTGSVLIGLDVNCCGYRILCVVVNASR